MSALSDERIEQLIATLFVLPASQKIVKVDRDEVLSLIREVKSLRADPTPWDRQRARERRDLNAKGFMP